MTPEQRARVNDLFAAAVETLSGSTAPLNLRNEDQEVLNEVQRLLRLHYERGSFLKTASETEFPQTFQPGQTVAGRYRIIEVVGHGGMGEVYKAEDSALGTIVALKTILPQFVSDETSLRRFRQEISLAQQVTHPNVCRVFDLQRHEDSSSGRSIVFLTMEYLNGTTLANRLEDQGRFTYEQALPLILQMTRGIEAAHSAGVIHRDLKSLNVMLVPQKDGGERAVITDFGLARPAPSNAGDGDRTATIPQKIMGTPAYMAPELFLGAPASISSDLYALGVIQFEMAAGRRPAPGAEETLRSVVPGLEPVWEAAILRCLNPSPEMRFQSAAQLIQALSPAPKSFTRRIIAAAAVALLLVFVLFAGLNRDRFDAWLTGVPDKRHIAVLPFAAIGGGQESQAFAEGLTETITSKLSELEQFQKALWVVPSSEVRNRQLSSVEEARKAFGVTLVLTGTAQRQGDLIIVTVNLIDARSLKQLQSRTIEVPSRSAAALQARVIGSLSEMIGFSLQEQARRVAGAGQTNHPEAYQLYQEGLGYLRRTDPKDVIHAIKLFQEAIAKDSQFALAFARLGEGFWRRHVFTKNPADAELAELNVRRALQLEPESAAAQTALAVIQAGTGRHHEAFELFERVLKVEPTNPEALTGLARVHARAGRVEDAERAYLRAIDLRPDYWGAYNQLGGFYAGRAEYEKALRMFEMVAELTPESPFGFKNMGAINLLLGNYAEAESALHRANRISPSAEAYSNLSVCATFQGRHREAVKWLEKAVELAPNNDHNWRNLGDAYQQVPELAERAPAAYQKALDAVEQQLSVDPTRPEFLLSYALYQAKLKNPAQAIGALKKADASGRLNAALTFKAAVVWELVNDRDRALMTLRDAIQRGYSREQINKEPELERLRQDPRYALIR